jgi:hypothetical protein
MKSDKDYQNWESATEYKPSNEADDGDHYAVSKPQKQIKDISELILKP